MRFQSEQVEADDKCELLDVAVVGFPLYKVDEFFGRIFFVNVAVAKVPKYSESALCLMKFGF